MKKRKPRKPNPKKMRVDRFLWLKIIFLVFYFSSYGQVSKSKIYSLGAINNFDKEYIKDAARSKRIVFIGEHNHFAKGCLSVRNKVVKYLVDSLGFNNLILEADLLENHFAFTDALTGRDSLLHAMAFDIHIFPTFFLRQNIEYYTFIFNNYKSGKLKVTGMDIGGMSNYSAAITINFPKYCFKLDSLDFVDGGYLTCFFDLLCSGYWQMDTGFYGYKKYLEALSFERIKDLKDSVQFFLDKHEEKAVDKDEFLFWNWALDDHYHETIYELKEDRKCFRYRDSIMAENILRVMKKYPYDKFIISASNYHIADYRQYDFNYPCNNSWSMYSFFMNKYNYRDSVLNIACMSIPEIKEIKKSCGCRKNIARKYSKKKEKEVYLIDVNHSLCLKPSFDKPYNYNWSKVYSFILFSNEIGKYDWVKLPVRDMKNKPFPFVIPNNWYDIQRAKQFPHSKNP